MESMTGFGRGSSSAGAVEITVELRSVNNKGLDLRIRIPSELGHREEELRRLLRESFSRGSIQCTVTLSAASKASAGIDRHAVRALVADLVRIKSEFDLSGDVDMDLLGRFAPLLRQGEAPADQAGLDRALGDAVSRGVRQLKAARRREGAELKRILRGHLAEVARLASAIRSKAEPAMRALRSSWRERLRELGALEALDAGRLEAEVALLVSRRDFTEETNRLSAHLKAFRAALGKGEPVGRTLEFLSQEILRELTTTASKAPGDEIAGLTVTARSEVEKLREQLYNVE
jgi:uncharacterized protein (TIGR00255 family)